MNLSVHSDRDALAAMAAFSKRFSSADFSAGQVSGGERIAPGVQRMPFAEYDVAIDDFIDMTYEHGWIVSFGWPEWQRTEEARQLFETENGIAGADIDQLRKLVTCVVRRDKFCEGSLLSDFKDGLIQRIVARAAKLFEEHVETP